MLGHDLVYNEAAYGEVIARSAGTFYNPKNSSCIARVVDGELLAGVVFTNYVRGVSVMGHTAVFAEHGVTRDLIYVGLDYPFNQLKVKRIFGFVAECNEQAQAFNMKLGFKVVARIEGMFAHDDAALVMRLDREDARLLNIRPRHVANNRLFN